MDGTDCPINRPSPFDTKWFSHKFRHDGLRYEVAINIRTGEICWINGPFQPGPWRDDIIFQRGGLNDELMEGEMVHADAVYRHRPRCSTPYNQLFKYERELAHLIRTRHETVNKRLKDYGALRCQFRHPLHKHGRVFRAAASVIQIELQSDSPLFHVEYKEMIFLHHCLNHHRLNVVYKALRGNPWLVPDKYADEDGVVYLRGGVGRTRRASGTQR